MASTERVEVPQGPTGTFYCPNVFLGVVNEITKDYSNLMDGQNNAEAKLLTGSINSKEIYIRVGGNEGVFSHDIGLKL